MILVVMMQVSIMKIIIVIPMLDFCMTTIVAVVMFMVWMLFAISWRNQLVRNLYQVSSMGNWLAILTKLVTCLLILWWFWRKLALQVWMR